jgi:hypothetical protein
MQTLESLESEHAALTRRIAELVAAASNGSADGEQIVPLTREASALSARIKDAKDAAEQEESEQRGRLLARQRARFEELLIEATNARAAFGTRFREACLELGTYCVAAEEAMALQNALVISPGAIPTQMPLDANRIAELTRGLDPLADLLDNGELTTCKGYGWNFAIRIAPVVNVIEDRIRKTKGTL